MCFLLLFSFSRSLPLVLNGLSADSAACTSHVSPSLLSSGRGFASTPARPRRSRPSCRALRKTIFQLTSLALALRECRPPPLALLFYSLLRSLSLNGGSQIYRHCSSCALSFANFLSVSRVIYVKCRECAREHNFLHRPVTAVQIGIYSGPRACAGVIRTLALYAASQNFARSIDSA